MAPNAVEHYVVALPTFGEILLGTMNHPIRADEPDHFHIPSARYPGHLCAERLADLHCELTHASRGTVLARNVTSFWLAKYFGRRPRG